jgi:predicted nucleic acid-binding protein
MKELFEHLTQTTVPQILLDTCFVYWVFEHQHEKQLIDLSQNFVVALTTFTIEELLYHSHHVNEHVRSRLRKELKNKKLNLYKYNQPVHPGNPQQEKEYIQLNQPELLELIPDNSDSILVIAGIQTKANILTRDKHHLFTAQLNNFLLEKEIQVYTNVSDIL